MCSRNWKQEISNNKKLCQVVWSCKGKKHYTSPTVFVERIRKGVFSFFPNGHSKVRALLKSWDLNRHNKHIVHRFLRLNDCEGKRLTGHKSCRDCALLIEVKEQSCCIWQNVILAAEVFGICARAAIRYNVRIGRCLGSAGYRSQYILIKCIHNSSNSVYFKMLNSWYFMFLLLLMKPKKVSS